MMRQLIVILVSFIIGFFTGDKTSSMKVHMFYSNYYNEELGIYELKKGNEPYKVCTTIYTSENTPAAWCSVDVVRKR